MSPALNINVQNSYEKLTKSQLVDCGRRYDKDFRKNLMMRFVSFRGCCACDVQEDLLVRHHHEADILCATQRLQWDWAMGQQTWPASEFNEYVPPVEVDDRLDLFLV